VDPHFGVVGGHRLLRTQRQAGRRRRRGDDYDADQQHNDQRNTSR